MKKGTKILFRTLNKLTCGSIVLLFMLIQHKVICQTIVTTPRYSRLETQSFKDSIVLKGDMDSWFWLSCTNDNEYPKFADGTKNRYELEIPYVLVLANRYNNAYACEEIYNLIKELYDSYFNHTFRIYMHCTWLHANSCHFICLLDTVIPLSNSSCHSSSSSSSIFSKSM